MSASYTEALDFLDDNYDRAVEKGITGNNRFEVYCVEKGFLPTEAELMNNEEFAYDWFMAIYYNQPQLLKQVSRELVTMVLNAAMMHSEEDEDMRYMIVDALAKQSLKK